MGATSSKRKQKEQHTMRSDDTSKKSSELEEKNIGNGGVFYYVPLDPTKEPKAPPKLMRSRQVVRHSIENLREMADDLEEKMLIANILREEFLRDKGKAAREFTERHAKVIQRKTKLDEDKIQKVQEKMFVDEVRLLHRPRMPKRMVRTDHTPLKQSRSAANGN